MNIIVQLDQQLQQLIASFRLPILDAIAHFLEVTGDNILLYCVIIIFLLSMKKTRKYGLYFMVSILTAILITTLIKYSVNRPRPFVEQNISDIMKVVKSSDYYLSFPSGHTTAIAVVVATYWLYYRKQAAACILAIIVMAWSRMYLYMHYPFDTLFGMMIGVIVSIVMYILMQKLEIKILKKNGRK